jgi:hypothetical protein
MEKKRNEKKEIQVMNKQYVVRQRRRKGLRRDEEEKDKVIKSLP